MEAAFTPMSEVEQARRKLMDIKMGRNVSMYIQQFWTLMNKVPDMTQEKPFSLLMRGLEPKIREQIGYHVEGDLGRGNGDGGESRYVTYTGRQERKRTNKTKSRSLGQSG